MNYTVLQKPIDYQGCPIYVRNTGENWEYLTVIGGEIYTASIVATKTAMQRLLGRAYTSKQVSDITQYMIAMAQTTIDSVLGTKHEPEKT